MTDQNELFLHKSESLNELLELADNESYIKELIKTEIAHHDDQIKKKLMQGKDQQDKYEAAIRDKGKPDWFVENFVPVTNENVLDYVNVDKLFVYDDDDGNSTYTLQFLVRSVEYVFKFSYTRESIDAPPIIEDRVEASKKMMLLKGVLHNAIYEKGRTDLISTVYNVVFNDHLYDTLRIKTVDELIPKFEQDRLIAAYREKEIQLQRRLEQKWKQPAFEKGEVVGAKDSEGRWWMSRVLHVFCVGGQVVYYVEFLGWGSQFNRLITTPWEVKRFNPYKHKYFYPAWKRKLDDDKAKLEKSLLKEEAP